MPERSCILLINMTFFFKYLIPKAWDYFVEFNYLSVLRGFFELSELLSLVPGQVADFPNSSLLMYWRRQSKALNGQHSKTDLEGIGAQR